MKRWIKVFAFLALVALAGLAPLAAAQAETEPAVTPEIVLAILGASIFGIPMAGLVEIVKRVILKIAPGSAEKKWLGYVTSGIVIAALDVITLAGLSILTVQNFLAAWIFAFAVANGFYKVTVKAPAEKIDIMRNGG